MSERDDNWPRNVEIPEDWKDWDGNAMRALAADLTDEPIKTKADAIRAIIREENARAEEGVGDDPAPVRDPDGDIPSDAAPPVVAVEDEPAEEPTPAGALSRSTLLEQEAGRRALEKRQRA